MSKRIVAALLLLAFTLASCRTWTPVQGVPDPMPESVRVELLSGERVEVMEARMDADTLVGRAAGTTDRVRIPTEQIASMEYGRFNGGRTALLVIGGGLLVLGAVIAIALQDFELNFGR